MDKDISAFPVSTSDRYMDKGMTLRDYFAAKAMAGLMENAIKHELDYSFVAEVSYKLADAMLKTRGEQ